MVVGKCQARVVGRPTAKRKKQGGMNSSDADHSAEVEGPNQAVGSSSAVNVVARKGCDQATEKEIPENSENSVADSEASQSRSIASGFKQGDLDQRPEGTREMPLRRSRLNVSYTVPSYFLDEAVMGE